MIFSSVYDSRRTITSISPFFCDRKALQALNPGSHIHIRLSMIGQNLNSPEDQRQSPQNLSTSHTNSGAGQTNKKTKTTITNKASSTLVLQILFNHHILWVLGDHCQDLFPLAHPASSPGSQVFCGRIYMIWESSVPIPSWIWFCRLPPRHFLRMSLYEIDTVFIFPEYSPCLSIKFFQF